MMVGARALSAPQATAGDALALPAGQTRFQAVYADETITVDGRLDEAVWRRAGAITEFIQREPQEGAPASYRTEVRIVFDDDALYIGAICHQPQEETRVQNLRRDFEVKDNDVFGVAIDGFLDKRNAVVFQTTPYGSQGDMEVLDELEGNLDWDARWTVRTTRSDTHWIAEMAIPWRTLRYPPGADRLGVLFARNVRSRNEQTSVPAVPRMLPVYRMAYEGELRGVAPPPPALNVQLNPYVLHDRRTGSGPESSDAEVGADLKWAITPSTILDVTWNTDFADADVDRHVTNFDRFSVLLPERRQFFLENANVFNASVTEWISPFFSRRIGLDAAGRPIPLHGGLRLSRRSAKEQFGLLAMQQQNLDTNPASTFAVARYSRNVLAQSRLGGMATYRHDDALDLEEGDLADNRNLTYTMDGLWLPRESFGVQGMISASDDRTAGGGWAGQLWAFFRSNRLSISVFEYYNRDYNPGVGLELLDANYVMHGVTANYDLRSKRFPAAIRSINPGVSAFLFESSDDGELLFGYATLRPVSVRFQNGAQIDVYAEPNWQRLEEPFSPAGIEIAPGRYDYTRYRALARTDQSATLAASVDIEAGDYFDGELTTYSVSARVVPTPHVELSVDAELHDIRGLGAAAQDTSDVLYGVNARFALNPSVQLNALYQHDDATDRSVWNLRLAWEYRPLSYIYVVYNRNEAGGLDPLDRFADARIIAKLTHVFDL